MIGTRYGVMCALSLALNASAWAQTTQAATVSSAPELVRVLLTPGGETTLASPVVGKIQSGKRLFDDLYNFLVAEFPAAMFGKLRRIHAADVFRNEINDAVVRTVFDVADNVRVLQRR